MKLFLVKIGVIVSFLLIGCNTMEVSPSKPNIVLILIDDLGYGDVGCYGSTTNLTPHIDQLASEGMLFTDFHSNGPMCTPTRAALLTGMYQNRLGEKFEGPLNGKTQFDEGMPESVTTIAEMLKDKGYATGMFGKWHLGYQEPYLPSNQGFDEFRGLGAGDGDHHSHIDRWGREDWKHNDKPAMENGYSVDLITDHSKTFIQNHKQEPFFLYISHLAIHFPWQGPNDPAHRVKGITYEDDKWGIIPDRKNVQPHVKAMVEAVDQSVGKIMNMLKELELDDNTLVIFTSDNGGYIHYNQQFKNISNNGPLRGQKAEVYEGGHRVPFIARWPGKITQGSESRETAMTMDVYSTLVELANASISTEKIIDGTSLSPILFENKPLEERTLFWKMDDEIAVRQGPWKLVKLADHPIELYNLAKDLGETKNLAKDNSKIADQLWNSYLHWQEEMAESAARYEGVNNFPEPKNGNTYVVAHRGAHNGIPENSLAAYQKAIDLGCDFVEIDVRSTKDGHMVSVHNSTVDAYVKDISGKVNDFTLAELKALDIGEHLGPEWKNTRIPTVEEILQLCQGRIGIYLDLKEPLVEELVELIKKYKMERNVLWCIPTSHMDAISKVR